MSIGNRIASAWGALWGGSDRRPTGAVPDLAEYLLNRPYTPEVFGDDYAEAFRKVPIVQQCTRQIQQDVASLPIRVYQVKGEVRTEVKRKDGNLVDLLTKANPRDTGYQFVTDTVGSLVLNGNAYWFLQRPLSRQRPPSGPPDELWSLPAQNTRVTPTENRGVLLYEYLRGGQWEAMDPANVIHFRDYNPMDEPVGLSRIEPVRREYETQFYALCLLRDFFKKGGRTGGVFTAKDAAGLSAQAIKAIQEKLEKLRGDRTKAWNDTVVDAALEYVRTTQTLAELDLEKNLSILNASIARSIGVPPMRLGIKEGGASLSDSGSAQSDAQNYWFGTIAQVTSQIAGVLTEKLAPLFGPNLLVEFDLDGVLSVQAAKLAQAKTVKELTGRAVLTVNEGRKIMGKPPIDDPAADKLYEAPVPTFGPPPSEAKPDQGKGDAPRPAQEDGPESKPAQQARLAQGLEREMLRRRKSADLARYERMVAAHFATRFAKQKVKCREWLIANAATLGVQAGRVMKGIAIAPLPIPIELPDDDEGMQELLQVLLVQRGEAALADIGVELAFNAHSTRAADFIRRNVEFVLKNVDETTSAAIHGELVLGLEQGEGLADIIKRVDGYFDMAQDSRAALIGRTETTRAYNFASNEAYQQSGVVGAQEWLTARDGLGGRHAEDPLYADLDGQTVGLEDKFHVGNEWLAYPGDGPPSESCNCRCTISPAEINANLRRTLNERESWERMFKPDGNGRKSTNRLREWMAR